MEAKNRTKTANSTGGMLFFCATPIGHLQDITLRVLNCLKTADYIAVENTSHSRKLLNCYGIRAPLLSYREAGREKKEDKIINLLQRGARIALLCDAGMPAISDPGSSLACRLREEGIPFTVLPGPSAALAALLLSGYPARQFVFWGFLSRHKNKRRQELAQIAADSRTGILFEAPHRLLVTLEEMAVLLPRRELAVCRELTKKFEEVRRGIAQELWEHFTREKPRGEVTLVISPLLTDPMQKNSLASAGGAEIKAQVKKMLKKYPDIRPTEAVKRVARDLSLERRDVYNLLLELQGRK